LEIEMFFSVGAFDKGRDAFVLDFLAMVRFIPLVVLDVLSNWRNAKAAIVSYGSNGASDSGDTMPVWTAVGIRERAALDAKRSRVVLGTEASQRNRAE
jgi:hypothetical protein